MDDLISRRAAIEALDFEIVHMTAYRDGKNEGNPLAQYNKGLEDGKKAIEALPPAQPEPAIPLSWIEEYIEWHKSLDSEFANLAAAHISVMVKKWRDEQDETD